MSASSRNSVSSRPLVSCLCVTRNRVALLRRAVACFQRQTYAERELIILCESDDVATQSYVEDHLCDDPRIRLVTVDVNEKLRLGALRNRAIAEARGEIVCQWDDDDWYRSDRIQRQKAHLDTTRKPVCVLRRWVVFNSATREAYLSERRAWEGSLLAYKSALVPYPDLPRAEDTPMIEALQKRKRLVFLDAPEIYVYTYHGSNTWDAAHFQMVIGRCEPISPELHLQVLHDLGYSADEMPEMPPPAPRSTLPWPLQWLNAFRLGRRAA